MLFYFNPILIAAAVIPAIVLLVQIYKADKYEREPNGLLVSLVLFGALSTAVAVILEKLGSFILGLLPIRSQIVYNALLYFIVVGCSEEWGKRFFLKRRTWKHPAFDYTFDGVIYAVFISLGFALWENIQYVISYGFGTALVRAVTAVPGHACFGVFMGMFYGLSKKYEHRGYIKKSKAYYKASFYVPALLHGCYDFAASLEQRGFMWIFIVFVAVMFAVAVSLVKKLSKGDQYIGENW